MQPDPVSFFALQGDVYKADHHARSGLGSQRDFLPWRNHKFSGDINELNPAITPLKGLFLLASIARFLYPNGCLACERPRP
jgi:hypothetical protein